MEVDLRYERDRLPAAGERRRPRIRPRGPRRGRPLRAAGHAGARPRDRRAPPASSADRRGTGVLIILPRTPMALRRVGAPAMRRPSASCWSTTIPSCGRGWPPHRHPGRHAGPGEAASGEEALAVFAGQQPEVTLMDLRLPGAGGIDGPPRMHDAVAGRPHHRVHRLRPPTSRSMRPSRRRLVLHPQGRRRTELLQAIRAVHAGPALHLRGDRPPAWPSTFPHHGLKRPRARGPPSTCWRAGATRTSPSALVHLRAHREHPREEHPRQAGGRRPHGGGYPRLEKGDTPH